MKQILYTIGFFISCFFMGYFIYNIVWATFFYRPEYSHFLVSIIFAYLFGLGIIYGFYRSSKYFYNKIKKKK